MSKKKSLFVCNQCGYETSGWMGRCPSCKEWNTMTEEIISSSKNNAPSSPRAHWTGDEGTISLAEVSDDLTRRFSSGIKSFDHVLGGGFVEGALVLVGGDPGIGKSTLLMQIAHHIQKNAPVLYVSGEESKAQIRMRAQRLEMSESNITLCAQTSFEYISNVISKLKPKICIIDSIQTMYSETLSSAPGSVSQAREVTAGFLQMAKQLNMTVVLVGHVTKDGSLAGPRVLEHMVDTVLYFEGEFSGPYRMIRATKNRFGATGELTFFEMTGQGLLPVDSVSSLLLTARPRHAPGSVVTAAVEGTCPVFLEIQALLTPTSFPSPQRMAQGLDRSRIGMLLAILDKSFSLGLSQYDAYINVVGGLKLNERASDLAVMAAAFSAIKDIPARQDTLVIGEVGLTGEIRPVDSIALRINEAMRHGFTSCVVPGANKQIIDKLSKNNLSNIRSNTPEHAIMSTSEIFYADSLSEAMDILFSSEPLKKLKRGEK